MRPPLKAVFFDAVGTLFYLPRPVGEHYREVALHHGVDLPADALEAAFRASWKEMPPRPKLAGPRPDDDKGWWRDLVGRVLQRTLGPVEKQTFDQPRFFEEVYAHFTRPGVWTLYPEVEDVLQELRGRGLRLGVISNFDRRLHTVLDQLRLTRFFDCIIISSEAGADKPDPAIFKIALASLRVAAAEAVHVGDDPQRDWGANIMDLDIFELDRPTRSLRDIPGWLDARNSG